MAIPSRKVVTSDHQKMPTNVEDRDTNNFKTRDVDILPVQSSVASSTPRIALKNSGETNTLKLHSKEF